MTIPFYPHFFLIGLTESLSYSTTFFIHKRLPSLKLKKKKKVILLVLSGKKASSCGRTNSQILNQVHNINPMIYTLAMLFSLTKKLLSSAPRPLHTHSSSLIHSHFLVESAYATTSLGKPFLTHIFSQPGVTLSLNTDFPSKFVFVVLNLALAPPLN